MAANEVYGQLTRVQGHYPRPPLMRVGRASEVSFVIDGGPPFARVLHDDLVTVTVDVSDQVSARLRGPGTDVTITLQGKQKRTVNPIGPTTWVWEVTPKVSGKLVLRLDIFAWVKIGDSKAPEHEIEIKTAEIPIFVQVTAWDEMKRYAGEVEPLWKVLATVIAGIGGLLAWLGWKPRKRAGTKKPKKETAAPQ